MRQPAGRAYLCTSGSEAVDTAIKLARAVAQLNGEHDRQIIVRRSRAFHGTNIGGTSTQVRINNTLSIGKGEREIKEPASSVSLNCLIAHFYFSLSVFYF